MNLSQYNIEEASPDIMQDLLRLCAAHALYEKSDYEYGDKHNQLSKALFSTIPKLFCLVAVVDGTVVGYITWMKQYATWDADDYLYMDCLYLDEEYRSLGIGNALIEKMKAFGRKNGIKLIQWQTPDFNVRAIKFYNRIGATSKSKERFFLKIE